MRNSILFIYYDEAEITKFAIEGWVVDSVSGLSTLTLPYSTLPISAINVAQIAGTYFMHNIDLSVLFTLYPTVGLIMYDANSAQSIIDRVNLIPSETNFVLLAYSVYFDLSTYGNIISVPSSGGTMDLIPILNAISIAKTEILNFVPTIDLTPIDSSLTIIKGYTDTLENELLTVKNNIGSLTTSLDGVIRSSLNGNGSELIDGIQVTVEGRTTIYTIDRSYMGLVQDNSYTAFYDLTALNGSKLTVPESLLTQYIAPVIVP